MEGEMMTEGLIAAPYGQLSCLGSSSVKCLSWGAQTHAQAANQKKYSIHTHLPNWKHIYSLHIINTLPSNLSYQHIWPHNLFRNLTDWQGRKTTRSWVKEEVCDSRQRKARGKQYGNGHVGLNTSYFHAGWLKQHKHWTSDFKKAVDCKDESPTDLHK